MDGLGSVRQLTNESGAVILTQSFDPYGSPYQRAGADITAYGWAGEQADENGLVYLRARFYAPGMGRFLNTDPSRMEMNPYGYSYSNPTNNTDPSGKSYCDGASGTSIGCQPTHDVDLDDRDLTDWLVRTMNENASSDVARFMRQNNTAGNVSGGISVVGIGLGVVFPPCFALGALAGAGSVQTKTSAVITWFDLVKDGGRWDFKDQILREMGSTMRLRDSQQSRWYEYSTAGNIHYAYVGRAAGFNRIELHGGATYAQQTDPENVPNQNAWHGDQPSDFAAIELGIALYNRCSRPLSESCFKQTMDSYVNRLLRMPRPVIPYFNERYGTHYPTTYFDGSDS